MMIDEAGNLGFKTLITTLILKLLDFYMKFPLLVNKSNKHIFAITSAILFLVFYMLTNRFPIFEVNLLPMTYLDKTIPLIPLTMIIYVSDYALPFSAFYIIQDRLNSNKFIYAFLSSLFICTIFFIFFPTIYPREYFPISGNEDPLSRFMLDFQKYVDSPNNCFPSLHVSSSFVAAFAVYHARSKFATLYMIWAILITISTLTTKQHYILDVIFGLMLGWICYWYFFKRAVFVELKPR